MLQRAVVALFLLAAGLLLLGALFADMEDGVQEAAREAQSLWWGGDEPVPEQVVAAGVERLELSGDGIERLELGGDVWLGVPAGTRLDGDRLELSQDATLRVPAGTRIADLSTLLPEGTRVGMEPGSWAKGDVFVLAARSAVTFPEGDVLVLVEGGRLSEHGVGAERMRVVLEAGGYTLREPARLMAPVAETLEDWQVTFEKGSSLVVSGLGQWSSTVALDDENRTLEAHQALVPAGERMALAGADAVGHGGPGVLASSAHGPTDSTAAELDDADSDERGDEGDADGDVAASLLGDVAGPPLWSWLLLAVLAVVLVGGSLLRRSWLPGLRRSAAGVSLRLEGREAGLPLALAPGQAGVLHASREPQAKRQDGGGNRQAGQGGAQGKPVRPVRPVRLDVRKNGVRMARTLLGDEEVRVPFDPEVQGDHRVQVRLARLRWLPSAREEHLVRVAPWPEQVARDYQEFVDRLVSLDASLARGATPRQVRRFLVDRAPSVKREADALVTAFEEANYSPRTIEELDWLQFVRAAVRCREAVESASPATPARRLAQQKAGSAQRLGRTTG